jgi:hypothetical protein
MEMHSGEREVPEHECHLVAESILQLLHDRIRHAAIRAFVVAELDELNRRIWRTLDVIAIANWQRQTRGFSIAHFLTPENASIVR